MIKEFINDFKNIDSKIMNVMNYGFKVSLIISLFSGYILTFDGLKSEISFSCKHIFKILFTKS